MGWLYSTRWQERSELVEHLTKSNGLKTVRHCLRGNNLWAVQEGVRNSDGKPVRFIALYLVQRGGDGWGYKDLDESVHPYYYNCPVSYIEQVEAHEIENGYGPAGSAQEWRAEVRKQADQGKQARKALAQIQTGTKLRLQGKDYIVIDRVPRRGYKVALGNELFLMTYKQAKQAEARP